MPVACDYRAGILREIYIRAFQHSLDIGNVTLFKSVGRVEAGACAK